MKAFELALAMELFFDHRDADFIGFRLQRIIRNTPLKSINGSTEINTVTLYFRAIHPKVSVRVPVMNFDRQVKLVF